MLPIIIVGSSGHAKVIIDIIEKQGKYHILGLIDDFKTVGVEVLGYKILGKETDIPQIVAEKNVQSVFVAIGDSWVRYNFVERIKKANPNLQFATLIHPNTSIAKNVEIGQGTVLMSGAIVNTDTQIGDFAIINTKASADHDCKIGNFATLSPAATLGGNVTIGDFAVVSINAAVKHGVKIAEHTIVGGGAFVNKDIESYAVAVGVPAKIIKKRTIGEKYL